MYFINIYINLIFNLPFLNLKSSSHWPREMLKYSTIRTACPVSISDPPKTYILLPKREREIGKVISNIKQRKQIKNSKLIDIKWVMFSLFLMYSRYRSREISLRSDNVWFHPFVLLLMSSHISHKPNKPSLNFSSSL